MYHSLIIFSPDIPCSLSSHSPSLLLRVYCHSFNCHLYLQLPLLITLPFTTPTIFFSMAQQSFLIFKASRSRSDTPLSEGPLWTNDQLVAEASNLWTQHSQQTDIHAAGGIGTRSVPARERPQGLALDRTATWIGYTVAISSKPSQTPTDFSSPVSRFSAR